MARLLVFLFLFSLSSSYCSAQRLFIKAVTSSNSMIQGITASKTHPNEIEAANYSNLMGRCASGNCVEMKEIVVKFNHHEPAIVQLRQELLGGRKLRSLVLSFESALNYDGGAYTFYQIKMEEVLISSVTQVGGEGGDIDTQITFKPDKCAWISTPFSDRGGLGTPYGFGWDFVLNKQWTGY